MVEFGERLRSLRLKSKMTQKQLAAKLGLTTSVISAYENGIRMPSYDVLLAIASLYSTSTDYLLGVSFSKDVDISSLSSEDQEYVIGLINRLQRR